MFSFLETGDLLRSTSTVCLLWHEIASADYIWKPLVQCHFKHLKPSKLLDAKESGLSWSELYQWCLDRQNMSILVIGAEGGADKDERIEDVRTKLATQGFGSVDMMNARIANPTLETLANYHAVLFYSYHGFQQALMGDLLASYVENGGGVVLGTYSNCGRGNRLEGKWMDHGYDPFINGSTARIKQLALGKILLPSHRIMEGVKSFEGGVQSSHGDGAVNRDAKVIAEWGNGRPLVAEMTKFQGPVVGLNFYPPSGDVGEGGWNVALDGAKLLGNAVYHCSVAKHKIGRAHV